MKLWIALGIAIAIGTYVYFSQPENPPVTSTAAQKTQPKLVKSSSDLHRSMKRLSQENGINEANFVEAIEETPAPIAQQTPDILRYNQEVEEYDPLSNLTNFEQKRNRNKMVTLTYGDDPRVNLKIEDREVRGHKAFLAADGDR